MDIRSTTVRSFRSLTVRERQILDLVEGGLTNAEVARRLGRSRPTVARLLSNAMIKLGAENRAHAVVLAGPQHGAGSSSNDRRDGGRAVPLRGGGAASAVDPEARALIGHIAAGSTLGEAAHALHLSRRTADRRLAQARRVLGVERTVVAIAWAQRLGWLD